MISPQSEVTYWGAVGGSASASAFQQCADWCDSHGEPFVIPDSPLAYLLETGISFKTTRDLATTDTTPSSDVHFTDNLPVQIRGHGNARVQATASMASMFELIYDTSDSDIAPFYSSIEDVQFDGAGLAATGINSNYCMHNEYRRNRFLGLVNGVSYTGYGVFRATGNVMRCGKAFNLVGGGGDSFISANDFYLSSEYAVGVLCGWYGGNVTISDNTFSSELTSENSIGVQLAGWSSPNSEEVRHVNIAGNEFCGVGTGIRADGKASTNKNVWDCWVRGNHTIPGGGTGINTGRLIAAVDCTGLMIEGNFGNSRRSTDATGIPVELVRCDDSIIRGNQIINYKGTGIALTDCLDTEIFDNRISDVGKLGTSYAAINLYGAGQQRASVRRNTIRQTSALYGQYGIREQAGADYNIAVDNSISGMTNPLTKIGTHSTMTAGV